MNFKKISLSLALTGLGVLAVSNQAQAYSFNFLNVKPVAGGGLFDYNFEFVTQGPSDPIAVGNQLIITGFKGATALSTSPVTDNVAGVLESQQGFLPGTITPPPPSDGTTATFTARANVNLVPGNVRYQTFTVRAADVPTGFVQAYFPDLGNRLTPTPVTPIPEPLTIMGSLAALGVASRCKKEFAKKQAVKAEKA